MSEEVIFARVGDVDSSARPVFEEASRDLTTIAQRNSSMSVDKPPG